MDKVDEEADVVERFDVGGKAGGSKRELGDTSSESTPRSLCALFVRMDGVRRGVERVRGVKEGMGRPPLPPLELRLGVAATEGEGVEMLEAMGLGNGGGHLRGETGGEGKMGGSGDSTGG